MKARMQQHDISKKNDHTDHNETRKNLETERAKHKERKDALRCELKNLRNVVAGKNRREG